MSSCPVVLFYTAAETPAASPAAIVVSQAPAVALPAPAVPSIGAPATQPAQIANVSEDSWNEIVEFGDSEKSFFMISESNALQDIACEYDGLTVLTTMISRFRLLINTF